jgi:hypothetical protein
VTFTTQTEKSNLKFIWKHNSQGNAEQKEQWGIITKSNFKLYYRVIAIKKHGCGQKQIWRPVEQNRRPGYESTQLFHLILTNTPETYDVEKTASSTDGTGKTR